MVIGQNIKNQGITQEELGILKKVSRDPFLFSKHISVIHPIKGRIPFDLYPFQKSVLWEFLNNRFNIVLKFRQAGLTELISMYCLWLAMYFPNKNIQIISIKDRVAKKVLRRIKYMYRNLPYFLQVQIVNGRAGEFGCVTEDTILVGDKRNFRIGEITPKIPGIIDVSNLNLRILTHENTFERVLKTINKGILETYHIENDFGKKLKCTWNHKLLTTKGWQFVKTILEENLTCIFLDTDHIDNDKTHNYITNLQCISQSENTKKSFKENRSHVNNNYRLQIDFITLARIKELDKKLGPGYGTGAIIAEELGLTTKEVSRYRRELAGSNLYISKIKLNQITQETIVDLEVENSHSYITKSEYINHNTAFEIEFSNGSMITSIPTTEDAGRSEAVSLLVLDEAAIIRWANQIWAAAFPTLSEGGSAILNSCVTGDTEIIGKKGNFRIDSVCPKEFGKKNISHLGLKVLTHTGKWQKVLGAINKGKLETWEIETKQGKRLKCTPTHKLLTPDGWRTVREIIEHNLNTITYDSGIDNLKPYPTTQPPEKEILKPIPDFPNYKISKLTLIRKYVDNIYDISVEEDQSYITNTNFVSHNTAFGVGNFFHKTWVDAIAGGNPFIPLQLNWRMHPERDEAWYRTMAAALGPRRTAQEIDCDFLTSGVSVFDLVDIKAIEDGISEIEPYEIRENGNLIILKKALSDTRYYIAADIASGRSRDYSAFTVMDRRGEEYAYFKGKMPVSNFANLLMKTGREYNQALVAPESNDIGLAVTTKIQDHGYPNLFYTTKFLKEKGEGKPKEAKLPGWYTTAENRPIIIDELEDDIRNDRIIVYDKFFVQEAYTFIYDERNRPVAMGKHSRGTDEDDILDDINQYTDDSILAKAITNFIRKGKITTTVVSPR